LTVLNIYQKRDDALALAARNPASGKQTAEIAVTGSGKLLIIGESFNEMLKELNLSRQEIEHNKKKKTPIQSRHIHAIQHYNSPE